MKPSCLCLRRSLLAIGAALLLQHTVLQVLAADLTTEEAKLTFAPEVPPPLNRTTPAKVMVRLEEFCAKMIGAA
jgi:hypothetical protein